MCDEKPCGPCAAKAAPCDARPVPIAQMSEREGIALWGPASLEVVSEDNKLIRMSAIEEALPQLFKRGRLTVMHKDQVVGELHEALAVSPERAPTPTLSNLLRSLGGEVRTGMYEVTPEIVQAFPHLAPWVGSRQFFAASTVWGDNDTSREAQREVRAGVLDSYSLSGMATRIAQAEYCDDRKGCRVVDEVLQMDLSAITLASRTNVRKGAFSAQARNPGARAIVIQQSELPLTSPVGAGAPAGAERIEQGSPMPGNNSAENGSKHQEPSTGGAGDVLETIKQAFADYGRRLEALEQGLAEVRGIKPADEPTNTPEEATKDEKPASEEKDEEKETPTEQAAPTPPVAPTPPPSAPRLIQQAAPETRRPAAVRTPAPAAAPEPSAPSGPQEHIRVLQQAAESGNPAEFREALFGLTAGKKEVR